MPLIAESQIPTISITNRVTQFEKVFVIGLPERTDKRDALVLMASLTGIKLTWLDGVKGSDVTNKALPLGWDPTKMPENNLGSWRGHTNAIRQILSADLSSALIMEDDMDWDVHLKPQLSLFASAAKKIQTQPADNLFSQLPSPLAAPSPYGQNWDMLWLGSCATTFDEHLPPDLQIPAQERDGRKILILDDETVPSWNHIKGNLSFGWEEYPPQTRIVHVPGDNICSFAYALSASGARKALEYLGLEGQHKAFDNHLSDLCRVRANGMRCVGVVPSLFVHHRPRGRVDGDSDINVGGGNGEIREVGMTENILYSTRLNLGNLLRGFQPERQWPD
ncbi:family 25 glycosyltransferase [Pseudomassariella vexata]|uniref:Family 25 glycosyltransferase n=1 Tax=Pseudomassariella vexata TaxID=1141098 RepID=A0A1Y2E3J0_9PEZI|nr:family 25 glycosyltransferase [Pseudomassariella vexata]ORY66120.1 family 25 glycosyltransferase [Pseudomassariella vexata]